MTLESTINYPWQGIQEDKLVAKLTGTLQTVNKLAVLSLEEQPDFPVGVNMGG